MLVLLSSLRLRVPLPPPCVSPPERLKATNCFFLVSMSCCVTWLRPDHSLGIYRPMRHTCLRTAFRSNVILTPNADEDTCTGPQISHAVSVCPVIFARVPKVVRAWITRLGAHPRHKGRGTPRPFRARTESYTVLGLALALYFYLSRFTILPLV